MKDEVILHRLSLGPAHSPTGRTRHYSEGAELGMPAELRIVALPGDSGYYLMYYDADGNEMTDTYHPSVEEAMAQAQWEFNAAPSEWSPP